jgi:hypothetical protein
VKTHARDCDRAARLVVTWIVDVLKVEGSKEAAPEVRSIEALEDFFRAVGKGSVAKQEADTAKSKIPLMRG